VRWIAWALGLAACTIALAVVFGLWILQPWADVRPMRTWGFTFETAHLDGDERSEWLAENFRNWDRDIPFSRLQAAARPHVFPRATRAIDVEYEVNGVSRPLAAYFERARVQGLLALHGGEVVFEQYRGKTTVDSRFHLWSASKSFTGTIIGMALHEGAIESLDDPIEKYAKQFEGTAYGQATIRHVMMMSSGVDFFHGKGFPNRDVMYVETFRFQNDLDDFAAKLGRRVPSGTDFNYLATDTHVLSAVLRGAYQRRYVDIVQEKLWDELGIAGDAIWSQHVPGPAGVSFGHCCLATRLIDFAHLGQLYLQDGVWEGRQLVPDGWVQTAGSPGAPFQEPTEHSSGYAMQFWVPRGHDGDFFAAGAFGQYLWIDTRRDVVIAQFASQAPGEGDEDERDAAFRSLATAIAGR